MLSFYCLTCTLQAYAHTHHQWCLKCISSTYIGWKIKVSPFSRLASDFYDIGCGFIIGLLSTLHTLTCFCHPDERAGRRSKGDESLFWKVQLKYVCLWKCACLSSHLIWLKQCVRPLLDSLPFNLEPFIHYVSHLLTSFLVFCQYTVYKYVFE